MSEKTSGSNSTRELRTDAATRSSDANTRLGPYRAPKLVRFGTLIELTQSGTGAAGETGVLKTRKPRPQS
jgi:hypothetical protein